jgi:hypothetical protein
MFMAITPRKTVFIYEHVSVYVAVKHWDLE